MYDQRVLRRIAVTVIAPFLKDTPNLFGIWPLPGDDELRKQIREQGVYVSERSLKVLAAFKEKELSQKSKEN